MSHFGASSIFARGRSLLPVAPLRLHSRERVDNIYTITSRTAIRIFEALSSLSAVYGGHGCDDPDRQRRGPTLSLVCFAFWPSEPAQMVSLAVRYRPTLLSRCRCYQQDGRVEYARISLGNTPKMTASLANKARRDLRNTAWQLRPRATACSTPCFDAAPYAPLSLPLLRQKL